MWRNEQYCLLLTRLPPTSWTKLKDLCKPKARQVNVNINGVNTFHLPGRRYRLTGRVFLRAASSDGPRQVFEYLVRHFWELERREVYIHLLETTQGRPVRSGCNCTLYASSCQYRGPWPPFPDKAPDISFPESPSWSPHADTEQEDLLKHAAIIPPPMLPEAGLIPLTHVGQLFFAPDGSVWLAPASQSTVLPLPHNDITSTTLGKACALPQAVTHGGRAINARRGIVVTEALGIHISNLCFGTTTQELMNFLSAAGTAVSVRYDQRRGRAMASYGTSREAWQARDILQGKKLRERPISVELDRDQRVVASLASASSSDEIESDGRHTSEAWEGPMILDGRARIHASSSS